MTPDDTLPLPVGTRVRIRSKGLWTTFFEGREAVVARCEPLHRPEDGFACYVTLVEDMPRIGACPQYFFISRDLEKLDSVELSSLTRASGHEGGGERWRVRTVR